MSIDLQIKFPLVEVAISSMAIAVGRTRERH